MRTRILSDDLFLKAIRLLHENPEAQQRMLAKALGISLGNANNCLRILSDRGWIQMQVLPDTIGPRRFCYLLTALGLEEKAKLTARLLKIKEAEYVALEAEIALLRAEVLQQGGEPRATLRMAADRGD